MGLTTSRTPGLRWQRVGLDALLVIVLGGAVVVLKQCLIHRNRQPLI